MQTYCMEILDIVLYCLIGAVLLALIIGLAIANFAGENMISHYKSYSKNIVDFITPVQFANQISQSEFNGKINCRVEQGFLNDHYCNGVITLSSEVAAAANVSSMAVVAHELGHALQYRDKPLQMKKFSNKLKMSSALAKFTMPLFVVGIVCIFFNLYIAIGIVCATLVLFFVGLGAKLSTVKIESEASENALVLLQKYAYMNEEQLKSAKKVLKAAKLTYVAAFLKSVLKWTMLVRKYDFY